MVRSWLILSGSGGTGKSLMCTALGKALCEMEQSVCLLDGNPGLRTLDLLMGLQDRVVFDANDVLIGSILPEQAVLSCAGEDRLFLLPAGQRRTPEWRKEKIIYLNRRLREHVTYVMMDGPGGMGDITECLLAAADQSILVITPDEVSLRNAEQMINMVEAAGKPRPYLLVNRVKPEDEIDPSKAALLLDAQLLGCVPEDRALPEEIRTGTRLTSLRNPGAAAICRVAGRFLGEEIPMPCGWDLWKGGKSPR